MWVISCGRAVETAVLAVTGFCFQIMLPAESDPEMVRCPLTLTVLKTKQLKMGGPDAILGLALDPPDLSRLETTILLLKEVRYYSRTFSPAVFCILHLVIGM